MSAKKNPQQCFQDAFNDFVCASKASESGPVSRVKLPLLGECFLKSLCRAVIPHIRSSDQPMATLPSPCVVVGELHGSIFDLFRIINKYGSPKTCNYVFLGNVIGNGEFQLLTIAFILLMKVLFPYNVTLLRGSHETCFFQHEASFFAELQQYRYTMEIRKMFVDVFNELPPACLVNNDTFCVSGGIGPNTTLENLRSIIYPCRRNEVIEEMVWGEPSENCVLFGKSNKTQRFQFGEDAVNAFLQNNDFKRIVRSHKVSKDGYSESYDGKLISIFSASNYLLNYSNCSGVLFIESSKKISNTTFQPCPCVRRTDICMVSTDTQKRIKYSRTDPTMHMHSPFSLPRTKNRFCNLFQIPHTHTKKDVTVPLLE